MTAKMLYTLVAGDSDLAEDGDGETSRMNFRKHNNTERPTFTLPQVFLVATLSLLLSILSFVCGSVLHPISRSSETGQSSYVPKSDLDKLHDFLPSLATQTIAFKFDRAFGNDPSENVTEAWLSLIPKGQGVVKLPLDHEYGTKVYNIAGFHSFHCLYTMRESFFGFHKMLERDDETDPKAASEMLEHGRHCFEYLRQVLKCTPDLNLEPVDGTGHLKTWDYERRCVNFEALQNWATEMRASDYTSIE
ncbi:hypothetical protein F5Y16DRAFT_380985 [Xylariaceae sp. FL0255]|nr:hypothetical protein F5Y16DRAFT_380985 [Xylariaceae sp. FL0255]